MSVAYLDTSALVKLVVREAETEALRTWIRGRARDNLATSTLSGVELRRAARRHGEVAADAAEAVLAGLDQIAMTPELLRQAGGLDPTSLRSLDAIHLATALRVGRSLSAFVVYDVRLTAAANGAGLPVQQPG